MTRAPACAPSEAALRAAEAFRNDPQARKALRGVWRGHKRYRFYPTQLFVGHVLRYLGKDPRRWRDWTEAVMEASNIVLREEGEIPRKGRRA